MGEIYRPTNAREHPFRERRRLRLSRRDRAHPSVIASEAEIKDQLHKDLQAVAASEKVRNATFHIRAGRPFDQICQLASEIRADLIVLSTHGRTGWERALMGSTAEKIIRHAPCPVLVTRRLRSRRKTEIALARIVVPVDFSPCWEHGLEYAIGLAKLFRAKLSLLNVIQLHHDLPPVVIYSESKINRWAREVAEAHMADLVRATDFGGVKYETEIKFGSPAQKICRFGVKEGADLILTSTHGRRGLSACRHRQHRRADHPSCPFTSPGRAESLRVARFCLPINEKKSL